MEKATNMRINHINVMLDDGAFMPERAHDLDAGYDLRSPVDIVFHRNAAIDTGVHIEIPKGYVGFLKSKSGLNVYNGITGEGVIDSGYTGSIVAKLYRNSQSQQEYHISRGDKIIQIVFLPIYTPKLILVKSLSRTERGDRGFGSTGR